MLEIFNELSPFIEDNYREISVREYARLTNISPPTASTRLNNYKKEGILLLRTFRNLHLYRANRESDVLQDLSHAYWRQKLSPLARFIKDACAFANLTLFGSLSKLEAKQESGIDLLVDSPPAPMDLRTFEKKYGRTIGIHFKTELHNTRLKKNTEDGVRL